MKRRNSSLTGEMWGVTAYFNPAAYVNKEEHLKLFSDVVRRQGLKLLIIELAFDSSPFHLNQSTADKLIQLRTSTILWHKERLINIGIKELPSECDRVVWLDADIIFENDTWVKQTADLLQQYIVVQPYDKAWWLSEGEKMNPAVLPHGQSTALLQHWRDTSERSRDGAASSQLAVPEDAIVNGHPGFAWAARRSLLARCGLYDRFIVGGGDLVATAAIFGHSRLPLTKRHLGEVCSKRQAKDVLQWMRSFYRSMRAGFYFTEGAVYHMWHGTRQNRKYEERMMLLREADFDPRLDVSLCSNGCLEWATDKPELHQKVREYFWSRDEDPERVFSQREDTF